MKRPGLFRTALISSLFTALMFSNGTAAYTYDIKDSERVGSVELIKSGLDITVGTWYLDCEHTFEIAVDAYSQIPADRKDSLYIMSNFALPANAVIVGGLLWDKNAIVKARLLSPYHSENDTDTLIADSGAFGEAQMAIKKIHSSDDYIGNGYSSTSITDIYNLKISLVRWGWNKKFRIRYLVPRREYDGGHTMPVIPSLNQYFSSIPRSMDVSLKSNDDIDSVFMRYDGFDEPCLLPCTKTIPLSFYGCRHNESLYHIQVPGLYDKKSATTSFASGHPYEGSYMMYWGSVPPELLRQSETRTEVIYIWKWFDEHNFVGIGSDGRRHFYENDVPNQASDIKKTAIDLGYGGAKVGLIHDRDSTHNDRSFSLAYKGTPEFDQLVNYLQQNTNKSYLLTTIKSSQSTNASPGYGSMPEEAIVDYAREGADDFTMCITNAFSMFSEEENVIRHIVVVTAGSHYQVEGHTQFYSDPGFDNVSFSTWGRWHGVPVYDIENQYTLKNRAYYYDFDIPKMTAYNYVVDFESEDAEQKVELISFYNSKQMAYIPPFSFSGYSKTPWKNTVTWNMYNKSGMLIGTYVDTPMTVQSEADSALAKLWSGAADAYTDTHDPQSLGGIFGIVDQYSYMQVFSDDSSAQLIDNEPPEQIAYFSDEEIIWRDPTLAQNTIRDNCQPSFQVKVSGNKIIVSVIGVPNSEPISVTLYNAKGQIVYTKRFSTPSQRLVIDRSAIMDGYRNISTGFYMCLIENATVRVKKSIALL
ncbi:MAG: hypothetical protein GF344_12120 [Chitinivibrionales bacterium]|nr:hypothetical protein [Chitinivibrionales bacterium]MBD3357521.1 hypothetical protein [Chitinivibrionales bacterium]